ncbi:hypothetical protein AR1Y2_2607 [Anaerostipes rhamnosivorans]|uniref:Uncharacterized protein n=1 Tax=Anaerostipes rhamnosivorans TaxID=1229621 RepID=A0A4P8IGH9_9FIRM|nr:hypothetical protein AR1Y2_2607 [Anaerostipes rhamnosivorans]
MKYIFYSKKFSVSQEVLWFLHKKTERSFNFSPPIYEQYSLIL